MPWSSTKQIMSGLQTRHQKCQQYQHLHHRWQQSAQDLQSSPWTRPFQLWVTQSQKSRQCQEASAEEVEAEEVVEDVEELQPLPKTTLQDTGVQSIQTFPKESGVGVRCIIDGVVVLSFVVNLQHVHGKISSPLNHLNETGANPKLKRKT